jgi:hypothetical protein
MKARNDSAALQVTLTKRYPKFWSSIKPNTQQVSYAAKLYPSLKEATVFKRLNTISTGAFISVNN